MLKSLPLGRRYMAIIWLPASLAQFATPQAEGGAKIRCIGSVSFGTRSTYAAVRVSAEVGQGKLGVMGFEQLCPAWEMALAVTDCKQPPTRITWWPKLETACTDHEREPHTCKRVTSRQAPRDRAPADFATALRGMR